MVESPTRARRACTLTPLPARRSTPRPAEERGILDRSGSNKDLAFVSLSKTTTQNGNQSKRRLCPLPPVKITPTPGLRSEAPDAARLAKPEQISSQEKQKEVFEAHALAVEVAMRETTKAAGLEDYVWPGSSKTMLETKSETPKSATDLGDYKWPGSNKQMLQKTGSAPRGLVRQGTIGQKMVPVVMKHQFHEEVEPEEPTEDDAVGVGPLPLATQKSVKLLKKRPSRGLLKNNSKALLLEPPKPGETSPLGAAARTKRAPSMRIAL